MPQFKSINSSALSFLIVQLSHPYMVLEQLRGDTSRPRLGVVAMRRYPTFKVRSGGHEDIPHLQGQEQWLCFAGAAVKRYPMSKLRETPVRQQALEQL